MFLSDFRDNQKTAIGNLIKIVLKQVVEAISDIDKGPASSWLKCGKFNNKDDAGYGANLEHFCIGVGIENTLVGTFGVDETGWIIEEDMIEEGVEIRYLSAWLPGIAYFWIFGIVVVLEDILKSFFADGEFSSTHIGDESGFATTGGS